MDYKQQGQCKIFKIVSEYRQIIFFFFLLDFKGSQYAQVCARHEREERKESHVASCESSQEAEEERRRCSSPKSATDEETNFTKKINKVSRFIAHFVCKL